MIINKHQESYLRLYEIKKLHNISPHSLILLNIINTEFPYIIMWFTDQNGKLLEIEDNVNMTFVIG